MATQPPATGDCDCIYSTREDYFSDNQAKELGIVVQTSVPYQVASRAQKAYCALKRAAAVITAAAESGLWVGPELAMETSLRTLITSLVVIYLLL